MPVTGIVAAVAGTGVAEVIGVAETSGVDWTELARQILFAGGGVTLLSGARQRGHAESRRVKFFDSRQM